MITKIGLFILFVGICFLSCDNELESSKSQIDYLIEGKAKILERQIIFNPTRFENSEQAIFFVHKLSKSFGRDLQKLLDTEFMQEIVNTANEKQDLEYLKIDTSNIDRYSTLDQKVLHLKILELISVIQNSYKYTFNDLILNIDKQTGDDGLSIIVIPEFRNEFINFAEIKKINKGKITTLSGLKESYNYPINFNFKENELSDLDSIQINFATINTITKNYDTTRLYLDLVRKW